MGLFKFHDRDGIVDRYVEHMLDDISKNLSALIIICNGEVKDSQLKKLTRYTDRIFIREDKGLDAGAFKSVLCEYLSWEELKAYDELVFFNDEFYGPFYPFAEVFKAMSGRDADLWGVTGHRASSAVQYDYIQTYFYVMRRPLLRSEAFRNFWKAMPGDISRSDVLFAEYELYMTQFFAQAGFKWDVLVDAPSREVGAGDGDSEHYGIIDYILLKDFRCPVIKRMNFIYPEYKVNIGNSESTALAFDYICRHTPYDENMIWDNLLRLYNVKELTDCLNLNYVLPSDAPSEKNAAPGGCGKVAVVMSARHLGAAPESLDYIAAVPEEADIWMLVDGEGEMRAMEERFPSRGIRFAQGRKAGAMAALALDCGHLFSKYELLCFVHDETAVAGHGAAKAFLHNMWHNALCGEEYVRNVVATFRRHPRLGFLTPPKPHHSFYFTFFYDSWQGNYAATKELAERMGLRCNLSDKQDPIAVSGAFWCRTAALRALFEHPFAPGDFSEGSAWSEGTLSQAVGFVMPYVAQHHGYYSGTLMSNEYAAAELKDLNCFLEDITRALSDGTVYIGSSLRHILDSIRLILEKNNEEVDAFGSSYKRIYLYGAGVVAQKVAKLFEQRGIPIEGFVVADDYVPEKELSGHNVYTLDEIEGFKDECGIVLAMNGRHSSKAEARLKLYGFKNIWGKGVI